jgi:hypothetical protein
VSSVPNDLTDPATSTVTSAALGLASCVDRVCADVIAPVALDVDADVVPRSHLDALAPTGIFGTATSSGASAGEVRAAHERLAGACLSTWFVVAQHQTPLQLARAASPDLRAAVVPLLESGTSIAGIAFSHLRRWPHCPVEVERCARGWRFTGTAPWYTGWGINDVAVLAGASSDGEVVFALVPAEAQHSLRPGEPAQTLTMSAARTVPLLVDGLLVPDEGILAVVPIEQWAATDRTKTANASPSVFGVTAATVDRLLSGHDESGRAAGARLADTMAVVRDEAYALIDRVDPHEMLDRRLQLRAHALRLCVDATTALVVSRGGRAMLTSDDAQMLARWSLFLTVQAQTPALREALLTALAR